MALFCYSSVYGLSSFALLTEVFEKFSPALVF